MKGWDPEFYDSKSEIQYQLGLKTIQELNIQNGDTILDIGCGTGRLTIEIAKQNPSGTIIGLDVNSDMIAKANQNLKASNIKNIQFITQNILQYFSEIRFNAIFSNSALHWVKQTPSLYQKIYDLLLPGGQFVAQMPTMGGYSHLVSYLISPIQPLNLTGYFKNWKFPINLLKPKILQKYLSSVGFQNTHVWLEKHLVTFDSPENLVDFLRTAALVPIINQVPPATRDAYIDYLINNFKSNSDLNLTIVMKRLFIKTKK